MNFKLRVLCASIAGIWLAANARATEFNSSFLSIDGADDVNLTQFARADYTPPGTYLLDVVLNGQLLQRESIVFMQSPSDPGLSQACLPATLVDQFGLKPATRDALPSTHDGHCIDINAIDGTVVRHNKGKGQLLITVPQVALEYADPNYIPPQRWSDGIPGAMLDYRVIGTTQNAPGGSTNTLQAYGTLGANAGAWRLRGDYQAQTASGSAANFGGSSKTFQFNRLYAYRALPSIQSTVSLGQTYLNSDIFDTFALNGAAIQSDDRMLPPGMRGYAAPITGVARTYATVTVSQQGRVLYATRVPPGAFALQDFSANVQGTLDVTVQEEDGTEQRFTVTTAAVPFLAREGELRYKAATGQPRLFGGNGISPTFGFVEAAYGLPHELTVYGGAIGADGYTSVATGAGKNLGKFGAVSADVTFARARLWWTGNTQTGRSYRFNYAKHFDTLDSDLRFFGYRFSDSTYTSFPQFFGDPTAAGLAGSRQRVSVSLAKRLGNISTFVSIDHTSYWNRSSDDRLGLTLARTVSIGALRNVSLNVSAYHTRGVTGNGNQVFLAMTIPLGNRQVVSTSVTSSSTGGTSISTGYSGGNDQGLSYAAYAGTTDGRASFSANVRKQTSAVQVNAQASATGNAYSAASLELDGSLVATQYGVEPHAVGMNGDTRLLVSSDGVPDVAFSGSQARTDARGYAVIGSVAPFNPYDARVNTKAMSLETTVANPVQRVVLTDGAIGFLRFDATHGSNALVALTLPSGKEVPFGASVIDLTSGKELGIVGEHGVVYLAGIRPDTVLSVRQADQAVCNIGPLSQPLHLTPDPIPMSCVASAHPTPTPSS
ncbi:fimbrial biogenesis outer membrane usher protein [Ralstonia insidiosa]|uniref:Fimbrial protein n=2 Tax=Burkholderiaceae TaxID=119060 RepID=A0A192A5K8_9RALS|nr:fimbria/pilus outer membrane usher protein [Ralstonia insidiosa]ANJ75577.1 fimbrial protein [Ralstonia insidiosa]KAB0469630.1 fimbrial biogenesis outer membrane usher protein [Ralstonia insidiosa]MBY4910332.1 fimbrial biogenesis outer membrane usher protein [Ralstonia insidiosa]